MDLVVFVNILLLVFKRVNIIFVNSSIYFLTCAPLKRDLCGFIFQSRHSVSGNNCPAKGSTIPIVLHP